MESKNIHKDHRKRVRERYMKTGIDGMAEHNILELLLFFGIPYKDTNPIAHDLIDRFGDLRGVMNANADELTQIKGMGENAAVLIKLCRDIAVKYSESSRCAVAESVLDYCDFMSARFLGAETEMLYMLCLSSRGKILKCVKIADGSPSEAIVDKRSIVSAAVRNNADSVIISHNHPNGFAVPSAADVQATKALAKLLRSIDVSLVDHIIVTDDDTFSMAHHEKYRVLFE